MSTQLRRISRFWMEGGYLTDPPFQSDPDPVRYTYGMEGDQVFRFRDGKDRQAWLMEAPEIRESVRSVHPLVKAKNAKNAWPDEDEDLV